MKPRKFIYILAGYPKPETKEENDHLYFQNVFINCLTEDEAYKEGFDQTIRQKGYSYNDQVIELPN